MIKKFILPLFDIEFGFYIGEKERKKFLEIEGPGETEERKELLKKVDGITHGTYVFVSDINLLGVVVHELHHATTNIANYVGIKDEETQAYIQQYMMGEYLHLWQNQK